MVLEQANGKGQGMHLAVEGLMMMKMINTVGEYQGQLVRPLSGSTHCFDGRMAHTKGISDGGQPLWFDPASDDDNISVEFDN
ncbi:unnamed protein product [Linum trigynum]|uniref:Uncharacterized protein n=1 Tax=Linum trigynum TaxID=586398 RepID=A0AAV2DUX1_9ROSI